MVKLEGVYAALPTLFRPDETIHISENQRLAVHLADSGLHGVLTGGSTGEYRHMTVPERKELMGAVCQAVSGKCQVIVQTGADTLKNTYLLCDYAATCGADACLVITPSYFSYSYDAICKYYEMVAAHSALPVIIYHYPDVTGTLLTPEQLAQLSAIPNIVGVKNTMDMDHTAKCISLCASERFSVISGYDTLLMGVFSSGGCAAMGVIQNVFPRETRALYDYMMANDYLSAQKIFLALMPFINWMDSGYFPGPLKWALQLQGFEAGMPRLPIPPVAPELQTRLSEVMERSSLQL